MDQVVTDVLVFGKLKDTIRKFGKVTGEIIFCEWGFRSSRDMNNAIAATQIMKNVGNMFILGTGENIHMNTQFPRWRVSSRT